jgi:hypothetical protein
MVIPDRNPNVYGYSLLLFYHVHDHSLPVVLVSSLFPTVVFVVMAATGHPPPPSQWNLVAAPSLITLPENVHTPVMQSLGKPTLEQYPDMICLKLHIRVPLYLSFVVTVIVHCISGSPMLHVYKYF